MAFDSRWERDHSTLRSQINMLDGLDAGWRPPAVRRRAGRSPASLWIWLAAGIRVLSDRLRTLRS